MLKDGLQIVLIESAALYSLSLTVLLVLYDLGLNSQYILLDWVRPCLESVPTKG